MKKEEKVLREVSFESKNGVPLVAQVVEYEGFRGGTATSWRIHSGEDRLDSMSNDYSSSSEMVSWYFKDVATLEDYIATWKGRFVLPFLGVAMRKGKDAYSLEVYEAEGKDAFEKMMESARIVMDEGCEVHYNDDAGVGHFEKDGDGYKGEHWRHGCSHESQYSLEDMCEWIRSFFQIGMTLADTW